MFFSWQWSFSELIFTPTPLRIFLFVRLFYVFLQAKCQLISGTDAWCSSGVLRRPPWRSWHLGG